MSNLDYFLTFAVKAFDETHTLPGVYVFTFLFSATFAVVCAYEDYWLHRDDAVFTMERDAQAQFDPDAMKTTDEDRKHNLSTSVLIGVVAFAFGLLGSLAFSSAAIQVFLEAKL